MQEQPQEDVLSWFAIGGIHGLPHIPWDNAEDKPKQGYCAHATVNFPTWHRPYVALFEVSIPNQAPLRNSNFCSLPHIASSAGTRGAYRG